MDTRRTHSPGCWWGGTAMQRPEDNMAASLNTANAHALGQAMPLPEIHHLQDDVCAWLLTAVGFVRDWK